MRPPHRNKRILWIILFTVILGTGVAFLLSALRDNIQFFYKPSAVLQANFIARSENIRLGGLVVSGSVDKGADLSVHFQLRDFDSPHTAPSVRIHYTGILPDLFREGQGIVVTGQLDGHGIFQASHMLAKHDENYQPDI